MRLPCFGRDEEHAIGLLIVSLEPAQHLLRGAGRDKHFEASLRHPLSGIRPEQVGLPASVRPLATRRVTPLSLVSVASPADHETQPPEDAAGLVGSEVCPVKARHKANYLLGGIAATAHDDEMIRQGLGKHAAHRALDCPALENEVVMRDRGLYLTHLL